MDVDGTVDQSGHHFHWWQQSFRIAHIAIEHGDRDRATAIIRQQPVVHLQCAGAAVVMAEPCCAWTL